ncbi:CCR4-NOT transcription complex subunit 2-like isoform X3 [Ptychodera flava]|uniref:CCR4-NOT transcription complex subunit 2-like isoform X3 n=1 Tax=Ptychodera flava TaxID=63121 RepID=UPI00396A7CF0
MAQFNQIPGLGQFGMSQEARKSQPDLSSPGAGDKTKNRMNFYKDSDFTDQNIFLNQSIFPPHRTDKDVSSMLGSQSLSQFGASLYGQQGIGSIGMGNVPRGMPNPTQQFPGRTVTSHHGNIPGHVTPTSTGMPMPSGLQQHPPSSPSRGILSVGPRSGLFSQVPGNNPQSGMTLPNRGNTMPSGLASPNRQSPSILAMQQQQKQQQQQQQQRLGLGTIGTTPATSIGGFGITRGQSNFSTAGVMSSVSQPSFTNSFTSAGIFSDTAPTLDLNDFPALNNRGRRGSDSSNSNIPMNPLTNMAGRTAYGKETGLVGMVNKQTEPQQEFQIQNEDFPALPGANNANNMKTVGNKFSTGLPLLLPGSNYDGMTNKESGRFPGDKTNAEQNKRGIQIHSDGKITSIPGGMVMDQFGMVGLLTFIKAAETDPNLVALALGSDLTTLGLNLNSPENLYSTFSSPWADTPCRPQDIDFHVPQEYLTNVHIRDKLAPIKLSRYGEDLLFYLYYTHGGDVLQLAAAAELYNRDWRYHKEERVWITRAPGMDPTVKTNSYERGTYYFFDCHGWRKVAKEFHLEYDKLEDRPHLPPSFGHNPTSSTPVMVH